MLPFLVANFKSGMLPPPQSSGVFCDAFEKTCNTMAWDAEKSSKQQGMKSKKSFILIS